MGNLPKSTDHSLEADMVRIKFYRNNIYHHNHIMEVRGEKFWMEISEALLRIASRISSAKRDEWKKSIENLSRDSLTPDAKECLVVTIKDLTANRSQFGQGVL